MKDDANSRVIDVDRLNNAIDSLTENADTITRITSLSQEVSKANYQLVDGLKVLKQKIENYDASVQGLESQTNVLINHIGELDQKIVSISQANSVHYQLVEKRLEELEDSRKIDKNELLDKIVELSAIGQQSYNNLMQRGKHIIILILIALALMIFFLFR